MCQTNSHDLPGRAGAPRGFRQRRLSWRTDRAGALAAAAMLALLVPSAPMASDGPEVRVPILRAPSDTEVLPSLFVGGNIEFDFDIEDGMELEKGVDDYEADFETIVQLGFAYQPSPHFRFSSGLRLVHDELLTSPDGSDSDTRLNFRETYLGFFDIMPGLSLIIGRQDFEDRREWIWDENLDGVRLIWKDGPYAVQAAALREDAVDTTLVGRSVRTDKPNNLYLRGDWAVDEDNELGLYLLYRDGRKDEKDDNLLYIGAACDGELTSELQYWCEAALVFGEEDGRDVAGFGVDVGATYVFDHDLEPALTAGIAFGSGDNGKGDDGAYRQTGLQNNNTKFNGVTSLKTYGEVFEPELSNIAIATLGAGIRPLPGTSIDLVYHKYLQHKRSDEIRDSNIKADPTGKSRDLGHEIDLVLGIRELDWVFFEITGGIFLPGDAFEDDGPAFAGSLKATIDF